MIGICLANEHKTTQNILKTKAFTVSMGTAEQVVACDYVGLVSGKAEPNKVEKAGFHVVKSDCVNAPLIEELPMTLECELESYDPETCYMVGKSSMSRLMSVFWMQRENRCSEAVTHHF